MSIHTYGFTGELAKKSCVLSSGFPTRLDVNQAVHTATEDGRGLKFRFKEVERLFYLCSENKGVDLRLCFRICKK